MQRRLKMAKLLAFGNTLPTVTDAISKEFGCTPQTVYRDYQKMPKWNKKLYQQKPSIILMHRLNLLNRFAMDNLFDAKKSSDKSKAVSVLLKIVREQIRLEKETDLFQEDPFDIYKPLSMPYECDPVIKELLEAEAEKQRKEKAAQMAALEARQEKQDTEDNYPNLPPVSR